MASGEILPSSTITDADLAAKLADYSGSDLRELCREAVVRVAHERAHELEEGAAIFVPGEELTMRPVCKKDFEAAMTKIRPSVPKDSSVRAKVVEWNEQYGENGKNNGKRPWEQMYM